ncbi:MAG TPA: DUF5309 family protein [Rhodocyclaceae bacterium]|jgi:hypothetical protein|nr:DUF5309 family protein [Bacteroidia bacterium]HNF62971.1 DUF5309 family protein [Rhodocyclaceae bacterium]
MSVGLFTTTQLTQDLAKKSFAGMITRLMPNGQAPLFGLTSMLQSDTAVQTEHGFFTKTMLFPQFQVSASGQTASDTTFTVVSTAQLLPGQIHRIDSTGENVIINAVISNTQVSVTRGTGTVAAASIGASVYAYQVGNAFEEASLRPNSLIINPVRITNYTQIFRNTWAISDTIRATQMIAGDTNIAESRQDCAAFHAADIEKALFFGQKSQGTRNGQAFRTLDGLLNIIGNLAYYPSYVSSTNVTTAGSTTNFTQLEAAIDPCFNQTTDPKVANERVLFVGGAAKRVLTAIGRLNGIYQMVDGQTNWGLQFSTFKTSRGTFRVIEHPLFNSNTSWQKMAVAVDLSSFTVAYLGDRKTQNKEFNQDGNEANDNGIDAVGGTLTTELTAVVRNPPANAVIFGLTAGAAG